MTLALYGKSRKRQGGLLLAALLAIIGAAVGGLLLVGTAFAHSATITGTATCDAAGTWHIDWTVNNDYRFGMLTLSNVQVDNGTAPTLSPLHLKDHQTSGYAPATGTQSAIPNTTTSVTLSVYANWDNDNGSDGTVTKKVNRPSGGCTPTGTVQIHKYMPKTNGNQPWQNIGKGQNEFDFDVHTGSAAGTIVGTGAQDTPISGIPQNASAFVTEQANSSATLYGFYLPDTSADDGFKADDSGNDKCNQVTDNLISKSASFTIATTDWAQKGDKHGVLHICAYNKDKPPTVKKEVDGNGFNQNYTRLEWKITIDNPTSSDQSVKIVEGDSSVRLDSVSGSGLGSNPCGNLSSPDSDGTFNCTVPKGKTAVLHVSKAIPTLTSQEVCSGKDFTNSITATYGPNLDQSITVDQSSTKIHVDGTMSANCLSILKEVTDGGYKITVTNTGPDDAWVAVKDAFNANGTGEAITAVSGYSGCLWSVLSGSLGCIVKVHKNDSLVLTLAATLGGTNTTCSPKQTDNTADLWYNLAKIGTSTVHRVYTAQGTSCNNGNIVITKVKDPTAGVPDADGSKFNGTVDGAGTWKSGGIGFGGHSDTLSVSAGNHTVAETVTVNSWTPVGWALGTSDSCPAAKASYTVGDSSQVNVTAGQTTYVCVMNTKQQEVTYRNLQVCKHVESDSPVGGSFTITVSGQSNFVTGNIAPGGDECKNYTVEDGSQVAVTETGTPVGWSSTSGYPKVDATGISLTSNNTITVKVGDGTCKANTEKQVIEDTVVAADCKVTFYNKKVLPTQSVTFTKVICPSYSLVPANDSPTSIDQTGGHGGQLATGHVNKPASVYVPDGCSLASGWQFKTYSGWNGNTDPALEQPTGPLGGPYTTTAGGSVTVQLSQDEIGAALSGNGLWVTEVLQPGVASFGALRCYNDLLNGDNLERIDLQIAGTANVNCVAYNVKPPRTIEVCKVIDQNNDGIADDATFTFDVRGHGSQPFAKVDLAATEGGEPVCKTVTVPDNSQSAAIEVAEWGKDQNVWPNATGFPWNSIGGQQNPNGTADLGDSGNGTVTFHNKKTPASQQVTLIKVICPTFKDVPANLPVDGIGWGTNDMPNGYDQNSLGAASPSGANDAVSLNDIPSSCVRVPGWSFDIKDSGGQFYRTVTTTGSIGSAGVTITLTADELQSALKPWHDESGYHGLYVSEQKQAGYGFAAMKCYKDHKLLDNTDGINLASAGTPDVYCIAYNVADPVHVTVAKTNNLGEGNEVSAGGTFDWTITVTVSGSQTSSQVHVTDPLPLGFTVDSVVAGPEFNCTASTTTTVDCILAVGASVGTHSITVHVTAPKPGAEVCAEYKNTVTIANLAGNGGGEAAPQIPREQILDKTSADNTVNVVDCTGTIVVHKQITTTHAADGTTFSGTVNASSGFAWGPIIAGGSDTVDNVPAGSATVEENPSLNGWSRANSLYVLSSGTQSCPTDPAAYTATTVTVVANSTVHVCVLNDHAAEIVLRTLRVGKVILGPNPDNTATFGGTVAPGGLSWSVKNGAVQSFGNLDPNVYTVTETAKAGYTTLGYKVYYDGRESCPSTAPTSYDYTGSASAVANLTQNQTIGLVCVYNQPFGSITVTKTTTLNGLGDSTQAAGWKITVSSVACSINQTQNTNASGVVTFTNLPTCNDYVVSEDVNSHGNSGFAPVGPSSYSGVAVTAGGNAAVSFTNNRNFNPCGFECTPVILNTPTPTTPTTPTATPVTPTATQPTATPTEPTKTEGPSTVETVSPTVQITLGEKTPGANATPLAPQTGSGLFGTGKSGSNLLLAVLGIFSLSAGFAVIAVANKNKSRS